MFPFSSSEFGSSCAVGGWAGGVVTEQAFGGDTLQGELHSGLGEFCHSNLVFTAKEVTRMCKRIHVCFHIHLVKPDKNKPH